MPKASLSAPLARHAMAYVLAGGRGTRLLELTDKRVKPAVYFGGKSRIIDFALSNALNSGIRHIAVATQYIGKPALQLISRQSRELSWVEEDQATSPGDGNGVTSLSMPSCSTWQPCTRTGG